jgi:hypothetical protein
LLSVGKKIIESLKSKVIRVTFFVHHLMLVRAFFVISFFPIIAMFTNLPIDFSFSPSLSPTQDHETYLWIINEIKLTCVFFSQIAPETNSNNEAREASKKNLSNFGQ